MEATEKPITIPPMKLTVPVITGNLKKQLK